MKKKRAIFWIAIIAIFGVIFIKEQLMLIRLNSERRACEVQLSQIKAINSSLNEQVKLTSRGDYVEKMARQKLGLVKPGEIIFKDMNAQK
jgi:cell division protein DivIC